MNILFQSQYILTIHHLLITFLRTCYTTSSVMEDLKTIVGDKPYFILTSNGEGHFEMSGFEPQRVYELEGNWIELRCSRLCHDKTYPALPIIRKLAEVEKKRLGFFGITSQMSGLWCFNGFI